MFLMEKKRPTRNRGFKGIEVLKAITSVKNVPQRTCFISLHYSVIVIHLKIKDGFSSACQLKDSKETPLPFKSSDCEDHRSCCHPPGCQERNNHIKFYILLAFLNYISYLGS